MITSLASINLEQIEQTYCHFMNQPVIQSFLKTGGRVFIATEKLPIEIIQRWIKLGHRHFSEKYVQEASIKWPLLRSKFPDIVLHQYGHLQSNKIKTALQLYDGLESLDSLRLLDKIIRLRAPGNRLNHFWVQVNLGAEPQKFGIAPHEVAGFIDSCRHYQVPIKGLMAIPPKFDPAHVHFQALRKLADFCALEECIMGMSGDYKVAIETGSNAIRVKRLLLEAL